MTSRASDWTFAESPTTKPLFDVVQTIAGPFAVGAHGEVVQRTATGWRRGLYTSPADTRSTLRAAAVTDADRTVWFAGDAGAVGRYDVVEDRLTDFSTPDGHDADWTDVDVVGAAGEETVYLTDRSGLVLVGTPAADRGFEWSTTAETDSESSRRGIAFHDPSTGHVCDVAGEVFETTDGGDSWEQVGIAAASVDLYDVAGPTADDLSVAAGSGRVYGYDGRSWTAHQPGSSEILTVARDGVDGVAAGSGGGVYVRTVGGWTEVQSPASETLHGAALDSTGKYPDVVVGTGGRILERGAFTARPDSELVLSTTVEDSVDYQFEIRGVLEAGDDVEDGEVTSKGDGEAVVTGSVGGSDGSDTYAFAGEILYLVVTGGRADDLVVEIDGVERSVDEFDDVPWVAADVPTTKALSGAVHTLEGPYAVGASGRVLARRRDGWEIVIERGPTTETNDLLGAAVTDDGRHVWFAGGSGVIGQYDVVENQLTDYSAPMGKTSTWEDIDAIGEAGAERVVLVNGSGEVLAGDKTDAGGMNWGEPFKPGGGSSMKSVAFRDGDLGYISDTNSKVYESTDGGETFEPIGIAGGSTGLYDVAPAPDGEVNVVTGDGGMYRYNGAVWTKRLLAPAALTSIERLGGRGLAAGANGAIVRFTPKGWQRDQSNVETTLRGTSLDGSGRFPDVAVGTNGTIVERGSFTADPEALADDEDAITSDDYRFHVEE